MQSTIGWIGLGNIGLPMAQRLACAGFTLQVWARRAETARALIDQGAIWQGTPEVLAQRCDIVVTMLRDSADVLEIQQRMLPHARRGATFIDMTTAAPTTASQLAAAASAAGVDRLDCPVTGGVAMARQGKLTILVGGEARVLTRCRPILLALGDRIVPCGDVGSGYRMKLVNQTMMVGALLGLAQGATLARATGLATDTVVDALGSGTASGPLFHSYLRRMVGPGGDVTFTLGMLRKDLTLARDECVASGSDPQFLTFALACIEKARARFGDEAGVQWLAAVG